MKMIAMLAVAGVCWHSACGAQESRSPSEQSRPQGESKQKPGANDGQSDTTLADLSDAEKLYISYRQRHSNKPLPLVTGPTRKGQSPIDSLRSEDRPKKLPSMVLTYGDLAKLANKGFAGKFVRVKLDVNKVIDDDEMLAGQENLWIEGVDTGEHEAGSAVDLHGKTFVIVGKKKTDANRKVKHLVVVDTKKLDNLVYVIQRADKFREWHDTAGKVLLVATFVDFNKNKVLLRDRDGKVSRFSPHQLSEEDRKWFQTEQRRRSAQKRRAASRRSAQRNALRNPGSNGKRRQIPRKGTIRVRK